MSYPSPYTYFRYEIYVNKVNGLYATAGSSKNFVFPVVVYDNIVDGSGDGAAQLGDVSKDKFNAHGFKFGATSAYQYIGETFSGNGFVASSSGSPNVLFTNSYYAANHSFALKNAPFAICYAGGTRLRIERDGKALDVAVEHLAVGDLAVTASGAVRPIRWLGHRTLDLARHPRPQEVRPIRIAAHAFGRGRPMRDLLVSPGHSICVDVAGEVLIPASALLNGDTVAQLDVETVTYWHVELDSHDILIADGLPAESYLDMGNRDFFVESDVVAAFDLSPDADRRDPASRTHDDFCRPYHADGAIVEAVRALLASRAGDVDRRVAVAR